MDTSFLYAHLRQPARRSDPRIGAWRDRVVKELGTDKAVISALVEDELAYRSILAWLRDSGDSDPLSTYRRAPAKVTRSLRRRLTRLWTAVDKLRLELAPTDQPVVERARRLMAEPGLGPRDAFHAAHALESGCDVIASTDLDFDRVRRLTRLSP